MSDATGMVRHQGSCHCGAVTYEVEAPAVLEVSECNCSICSRSGYLHLIVPKSRFHLLSGEDNLQTYSFDTHEAKHLFCKTCGIKSFYIPRSHPEGISVNVRCLDEATIEDMHIKQFDGRHWEENIDKLKPLPQE
jgi:hypothetical protein